MRLSISNLAWGPEEQEVLHALSKWGVEGVEIAPTKIAPWADLNDQKVKSAGEGLRAHSLIASSLQAIYFGRPPGELLGATVCFEALREHTRRVAEIAKLLEVGVAVFGAPRTRARGDLPLAEAFKIGSDRLRILGEVVWDYGLVLGIEPVPSYYSGDFLTTAEEVTKIVRHVDHPAVRLHLDTACVSLGGGDIAEAIFDGQLELVHMHASQPGLADFSNPDAGHEKAGQALREVDYQGWVAIEMQTPKQSVLETIGAAVAYVKSVYCGAADVV